MADVITATDSLGNVATVPVTVTAALAPVASTIGVAPRGTTTLAVIAGAAGVAFALTYMGVTRNISVGGVFVATEHLTRVGDRIHLKVCLPGPISDWQSNPRSAGFEKQALSVDDQAPPGMSLRFLNPSESEVAALETFLAQRDSLMP